MNGMHRQTGKPLSDTAHLAQSIADLLSTPLGSRIMRRDYGSLLPELIDQPAHNRIQVRVFAAIALALMRWEPRIALRHIALIPGAQAGQYIVELTLNRRDRRAINQKLPLTLHFSSANQAFL